MLIPPPLREPFLIAGPDGKPTNVISKVWQLYLDSAQNGLISTTSTATGAAGAAAAAQGTATGAQTAAQVAAAAAAAAQAKANAAATPASVAAETARAEAAESLLAPLASPTLTGTPIAPVLTLVGATPTVASGLGLGSTTSPTATAGAGTLPANPLGFLVLNLAGTVIKVPYYSA